MLETSARLLRLLSLLQTRRDWTGPQLAERLEVTTRTVRNDVERLRKLGYPIHSTLGVAGGYRLGAGASLPPLLLDDDEAVAVAVGLRTAASGAVTGIEDMSLRALAKIEQLLPSRLRRRVSALHAYTVSIGRSGPTVDADVLAFIASACRDEVQLRFDYCGHDGATTLRTVEPHRLVHARGRWYLVAWDLGRKDWRTFRVDRTEPREMTGPRFAPRPLPGDGDVAAYVIKGIGTALWRYRARIRVQASADSVAPRLPPGIGIEATDDHMCVVDVGADTPHMIAHYIGLLDVDFDVIEPPELVDHVRRLGERYRRAAGPDEPADLTSAT